ncbi:MAG: GNAT family N-acetyltransferase [Desulfopila sp.]
MTGEDLAGAAAVHRLAFPRQRHSREWLQCCLNGGPRFLNFVALRQGEIVGYIVWGQKSGFRPEAVIELEQIAVRPVVQGQGIGRLLIERSLPLVNSELARQGSVVRHILVTTRNDNFAQELYQKVLGARVEATIANLYSADEVIMVARNVTLPDRVGVSARRVDEEGETEK